MSHLFDSRAKVLEYEAKQRLVEKEIELAKLQATPQRQPLTDEELGAMLGTGINGKVFKQIARAIEAAHGIKGEA